MTMNIIHVLQMNWIILITKQLNVKSVDVNPVFNPFISLCVNVLKNPVGSLFFFLHNKHLMKYSWELKDGIPFLAQSTTLEWFSIQLQLQKLTLSRMSQSRAIIFISWFMWIHVYCVWLCFATFEVLLHFHQAIDTMH